MAERNNERNRGVNKIICTSMGKESTKRIMAEKTRRNEKQRKESPINCEMKETKRNGSKERCDMQTSAMTRKTNTKTNKKRI